MGDYVIRGTAADGQILAFACTTREMTEEARVRHGLSNVATAALGRAMAGVAMMGAQLKDEGETISIQIQGNGPLQGLAAVSDGAGHVRGYVENPDVQLPLREDGKLDVARAVGLGVMNVVKDLGLREPYIGSTHLVSSEIAEDLAYYYAASEQVPCAVALGVLLYPDLTVWQAGGYMIQLLPGCSEETAILLEERVKAFPQLTTFLAEGHTPEEVLQSILGDMGLEIMARQPVCFKCNCNRERVGAALMSIGKKDLQSLIDEGEPVEMSCHMCGEKYQFSIDEMKNMMTKLENTTAREDLPEEE